MADIEVAQADRDAAATFALQRMSWSAPFCLAVADGARDEEPLVQAFARHRLTQSTTQKADNAALVEFVGMIARLTPSAVAVPLGSDDSEIVLDRLIAKARALQANTDGETGK